MDYAEYIKTREKKPIDAGLLPITRDTMLFDFQKPIVDWALKRGKAAIFADTGTGKTAMQTHWADAVSDQTGGAVLMLAPLAVASQTIVEAAKFGITINRADHEDIDPKGVVITNYEQLHKFDPSLYVGLVLDESSIMKGLNGKVRGQIQEFANDVRFRLSCTATPSPNDFMELGTQCEFLGVMKQSEMLAMYFTHDSARTSKWRLKGHAKDRFFEWMASWAVFLKNPRDIGFNGDAYDLPPMNHFEHVVGVQSLDDKSMNNAGLLDRNRIRKGSLQERCQKVADLVSGMDDQVLIWCNLNDESKLLAELIDGAVEVTGSDKPEHKINAVRWFQGSDDYEVTSKGKLKKATVPCKDQNTKKNTTERTETRKSERLANGSKKTKSTESSTCESTPSQIERSSEERQINRQNTTREDENNTRLTSSSEIQSKRKPQSIGQQTQKEDLTQDCENTALTRNNTAQSSNRRAEDVQYADAPTQDAQRKSDCMSITATNQELSEDCSASIATRQSESSRTTLQESEKPPTTLKRVLISKPKIYGYGLNLQGCNKTIFTGLSDSWEQYYQAVRRVYRFGQLRNVDVHVVSHADEGAVVQNIKRKDDENNELSTRMLGKASAIFAADIGLATYDHTVYNPTQTPEFPLL